MDSNLLLCRPGFESDCAAELDERGATLGLGGFARARPGEGWLTWHAPGQPAWRVLSPPPVFARTAWPAVADFDGLPEGDRVTPLLEMLPEGRFAALRLEHADTNAGRALQRFLRGFRKAMEQSMRRHQLLDPQESRILHIFFRDSSEGVLGVSRIPQAGPWENGIPRLRLSARAPSRSALKIEEACLRLMTPAEREQWLRHGRSAVDLGAAPGGWTWYLASRGVQVLAVDHGRLAPELEAEYPVEHCSADAFTFKPAKTVDWLVCDVVDKPARTLSLMEKWLRHDWARLALFNLKLPMKRRHASLSAMLESLQTGLASAGREMRIAAAHLYHDREEVTVLVMPDRQPAPAR
jgi:23S rRNA (cytidine2498-2'-O)-methyltransferase